jgi:hypothetical protein
MKTLSRNLETLKNVCRLSEEELYLIKGGTNDPNTTGVDDDDDVWQ